MPDPLDPEAKTVVDTFDRTVPYYQDHYPEGDPIEMFTDWVAELISEHSKHNIQADHPYYPEKAAEPMTTSQAFNQETMPPEGWQQYRKSTLTEMVRINGPFRVNTPEGIMECDDGWLAKDSNGGLYPVADDVHQATYELAEY